MKSSNFTLILIIWASYSFGQRLDLPDMLKIPFSNTQMTNCRVYSIQGENTTSLLIGVGGSDGHNYKAQPHTASYNYAFFLENFEMEQVLQKLESGSFRGYPSIEIASTPLRVNNQLVIQQLAASGSLRFYLKNLYTGTDQYLPASRTISGWTSISDKPIYSKGEVYSVIVRCDGIAPDGSYDYNGIDNDTIYLARLDWTSNDVEIIHKYFCPGIKNQPFQYLSGDFEYDSQTKLLEIVVGSNYYEYIGDEVFARKEVALTKLYSKLKVAALKDTNYYYLDHIYNSEDSTYYGWKVFKWYLQDNQFVADTIDFLWQEEPMTRSNIDGLSFRFYKMDEDFIYYGKEKAPEFDPSMESRVELVKARHSGEVIWRRTFFDAELPGSIESLQEINDTLICTGLVYHYPLRSGMEERKMYPFIRMMNKNGEFIHQPQPEADPIYPNPFQVDFYLNLPDLRILHLYDFNGKLIAEKAFQSEHYQNRIEWPELEAGLYLLKAIDAHGRHFEYRIMKSD